MRSFRSGMSPVKAGLIAVVIIVIGSWLAFTKDIPFTQDYRVQAVFENSNLIAERSPVRIAGIDVGKVVGVERYKDTDMTVVTMEIQDEGRPVREDATVKVRPRLFLEGNFYVDLKPGSPAAEELDDGGLIPVSQTSAPVQLDNVLTALQADTRRSLQKTLVGFGEALDSEPTPEDDADQDPDVQGLTAGQAINKSLETSVGALRGSAIVSEALRGTEPRDLSRLVKGLAGVSRGLAQNDGQLAELLTNFNVTTATLASRAPQLRQTVELLGPFASNLQDGLDSVDAALPATQAFSRDILPGLRETPATAAASMPWLDQLTPLFSKAELGGVLDDLSPATRNLASATRSSKILLPKSNAFNRCVTDVIIPTGNVKVDDGEFSANTENYKEFWHSMVGQAGEGQGFDGNGPFIRAAAPSGGVPIRSGKTNYQREALQARAPSQPLRTSPAFPSKLPPLRRDVPCYENGVPDVNGSASVGPADGSAADAAPPSVPPAGVGAVIDRSVFTSGLPLRPITTLDGGGSQ